MAAIYAPRGHTARHVTPSNSGEALPTPSRGRVRVLGSVDSQTSRPRTRTACRRAVCIVAPVSDYAPRATNLIRHQRPYPALGHDA